MFAIASSGFEITRPVEIGNKPGLFRIPPEQVPRSRTRGGIVKRCEMRKPAKMISDFPWGLVDDWQIEAAANHARNVAERHALLSRAMVAGVCETFLDHEPEEMGGV